MRGDCPWKAGLAMNVFEYSGSKYVTINGKSFFLIQGYGSGRNGLIFAQVAGSSPLFPEDMPDKKWKLVKTKWQDFVVHLAYNQDYLNYQSDKAKGKLLFPAASTKGSFFLLLKHVNERYSLKVSEEKLSKISEERHRGLIEKISDEGNAGVDAYMLELWEGSEERWKEIICQEKENQDG